MSDQPPILDYSNGPPNRPDEPDDKQLHPPPWLYPVPALLFATPGAITWLIYLGGRLGVWQLVNGLNSTLGFLFIPIGFFAEICALLSAIVILPYLLVMQFKVPSYVYANLAINLSGLAFTIYMLSR